MISFHPTTVQDRSGILKWIEADPFHREDASTDLADEMITGLSDGITTFVVHDSQGPVFYLRLKNDSELIRMSAQFGPEDEVSRSRVAAAISVVVSTLKVFVDQQKAKGLIYWSNSPTLIKFLSTLGFEPRGENEYVWMLQEKS